MRFNSRIWYLLSVLLFVAAVWFWLRGNEEVARRDSAKKSAPVQNSNLPPLKSTGAVPQAQTTPSTAQQASASAISGRAAAPPPSQSRFPYRLRNTDQSLDQLGLSDTAVLLDNAFIDTASATPLVIPEHLRTEGDPGSYVVQTRGPMNSAFHRRLQEAGAEFVSYIPNNAGLVRATEAVARQLAALPEMQSVLRYEPYYKIAQPLLPAAVEQQSLPLDQALNLILFPGEREKAMASLREMGAEVLAEDHTPFGPMLTINPRPDKLIALAQLPEVQRIEPANPRVLLNDLTRVRVRVSTDTAVTNNYLDLTGANVLVNLNDSGVDELHPDLAGRVSTTDTNTFTLSDFNGHGTHVAGTIAGTGVQSSTVTNALGSATNANFRGKAPAANLFVLPIDLRTGPLISDTYLQESAATANYTTAGRTNAIISNNSWGYINAFEYNASTASFDAAVRDALPGVRGSQPILYVFSAGNSGFGTTNGTVGQSDTILSPATAKNVISVGAIENFRGITNEAFAGFTDSDNEVAAFSSRGNVGIGTEGEFGRFKPDVVAPGTFIVSTRSANMVVDPAFPDLGASYRYESGTSMAAPAVSGVLALMQEFFEQKLGRGFSPALMKALLINGARSVNPNYDLQVRTPLNFQGWGLVILTNSLPDVLTNASDEASWPIRFVDQSPENSLATSQHHTWTLTVSSNAVFLPLRATLVWTDPPGNPGAGIKLVNDLDLVVTNLDTGEVFLGNNIPSGFDFTAPTDTNSPVAPDFVNNVENVLLEAPLGTNYSISVIGRRVNVNAVTANTNDVVQDYALVVSSGNGQVLHPIESFVRQTDSMLPPPPVTTITNGVPLLQQRVGANFQLAPSTNGIAAQWNFYVFTNALFTNNPSGLVNGSNVAFVTFLPPNVSRSRNLDADIDLYVSTDAQLTNLVSAVVDGAFKSRGRSGTELVIFTNAAVGLNSIFYIGVKSEDQQAAEYGIAAFSTEVPFESTDADGNLILRGVPPNVLIPDGSPSSPGFVPVFAFGISENPIARVVVTNEITHQSVGDLLGNLSHEDQFAVLNNHNAFGGSGDGFYRIVYDDSQSGQSFFSRHTDGPGTLNNFAGQSSSGVWMLTMNDDSVNRTGVVNSFTVRIEPQQLLTGTNGINDSVLANQWQFYFIDVPLDANRLTVLLSSTDGPLNLYLRHGAVPTTTEFDKSALIDTPGGSLSIGLGDVPPLNAGRYFIGVFNPTAATVNYNIRVVIDRDLAAMKTGALLSADTPLIVTDDAIINSSIFVSDTRPVVDVQAGVRIEHARGSDLVMHLISPQGTRVILTENRGRTNQLGYGVSDIIGSNIVTLLTNSFETAVPTNYFVGDALEGWTVTDKMATVRDNVAIAANGTRFLALRGGMLSRVLPTTAGRNYRLSFSYRLNPGELRDIVAWWPANDGTAGDIVGGHTGNITNISFVPGVAGDAFGFDGVDDQINVADAPELDLFGDYTIEFWVNPDAAQNPFATILRKEDPTTNGNGFGIEMDGVPGSNLYYAGWKNAGSAPGDECWTTAGFQLIPGAWQHVAIVKSNATRLVYINAALVGAATCTSTSSPVAVNNAPLQLGFWSGQAGSFWRGGLDELAMYRRALSPADIYDIFIAGDVGKCGMAIPPVTCSSGTTLRLDGAPGITVPGNLFWASRTMQFRAAQNGTTLDVVPVGAGLLLDNFLLVEEQITTRPSYTVFTDNTNLANVLIKFASPPFTNSTVIGTLTNRLVVDDGFEKSPSNIYNAGTNVSGWLVSTGQVQVFSTPNPLGGTNPFPARVPGTNFLVLNGGWDAAGVITNWVPGGIVTNFNTTANREYVVTFFTALDPTPVNGNAPPGYPTNPAVILLLTNGVAAQPIVPTTYAWQSNTFTFRASGTLSSLEFRSVTTNGALLDVVQVTELADERESYFLPEESLKPFVGESALGNWRLEIWDNREGTTTPLPPLLLSWKLNFIFANTNAPAITLTNCTPFTNVVSVYETNCVPRTICVTGSEIKYFVVEVPRSATQATNILVGGGDLVLLYNRDGLPTGLLPGDFVENANPATAGEMLLLTTNSPPGVELRPGQRYYLGVANANFGETNCFTLSVAFDRTDVSLVNSPVLTNGICYANTIPVTNAIDYYQFTVSTNATSVSFELTQLSGNVDLVLRKATPVLDPLPRPNPGEFDYISQNTGTNAELILVNASSTPVPLGPGVWYLGVFNNDSNAVTYSVCVNESTNSLFNIIRLTNAVPLDFIISSNAQFTNFFVFTVGQPVPWVQFELYNLTGDADLLVDVNYLPSTNFFLTGAAGSPGVPVVILLDTNMQSDLTGDWYLAVNNRSGTDLGFTIKASAPSTGVIINPQIVISNNFVCLSWASVPGQDYYIEGTPSLTPAIWTPVSSTITATSTNTTYCLLITGTQQFFRVVQGTAPSTGTPIIVTPQLDITNNQVCLSWSSLVGTNYVVESKTNLMDPGWTTVSTITATNTTTTYCALLTGVTQFFQVVQGTGGGSPAPAIGNITFTAGAVVLNWTAQPNQRFQVQYSNVLPPVWINFPNIVTSATVNFTFTDDGSQTGGVLSSPRFYQLQVVP
jgi:subtilisin family serine protease/subtilisin-like proprotein convertase family protein